MISREQVEKVWRGEWEWFDETVGTPIDGYMKWKKEAQP